VCVCLGEEPDELELHGIAAKRKTTTTKQRLRSSSSLYLAQLRRERALAGANQARDGNEELVVLKRTLRLRGLLGLDRLGLFNLFEFETRSVFSVCAFGVVVVVVDDDDDDDDDGNDNDDDDR
jgi:hypothetical protein